MNSLKKDAQNGFFSDDEQRVESLKIQKLTDEKISLIDELAESKAADIKRV